MVSYTILEVEEPKQKETKTCSIDAAMPMTGIPEKKSNGRRFAVKFTLLSILIGMAVVAIPLVGCFFISSFLIQEKLLGKVDGYPAKNVPIPQASSLDIPHTVPPIVNSLFVVLLLLSYVHLVFFLAVRSQGKSELKTIVIDPKFSVIPESAGDPQEKKEESENRDMCHI